MKISGKIKNDLRQQPASENMYTHNRPTLPNPSLLVLTFLIFCFTHSPLQAATMVFNGDFESGNISGFICSGNCPTAITSPVASGKYAGSFDLAPSMPTNHRTEATIGPFGQFHNDREYWFGYNFRFENWAKDNDNDTGGMQIHLVAPKGGKRCVESAYSTAPFSFITQNDQLKLVTYGGITRWSQPLKHQQWQSAVFHFIPSRTEKGLIEAWVDGVKIASVAGVNIDSADKCGVAYKERSYLKLGIYKWKWKRKTTQSSRRQIIIDNVKVASGADAYSLVASNQTSPSFTEGDHAAGDQQCSGRCDRHHRNPDLKYQRDHR